MNMIWSKGAVRGEMGLVLAEWEIFGIVYDGIRK